MACQRRPDADPGQALVQDLPQDPGSPARRYGHHPPGALQGLAAHLAPGGEGWLILSDLAEHLGLRTRETLMQMIESAGLQVLALSAGDSGRRR